jgi:hypothetical protein
MSNCTRYLGLDVHAETITAAIAEGRGKIRSLGKFPNRPEAVRKFIEKLGGGKNLKVCYEAGPTGYALYWQLTKLGVDCEVSALLPKWRAHAGLGANARARGPARSGAPACRCQGR